MFGLWLFYFSDAWQGAVTAVMVVLWFIFFIFFLLLLWFCSSHDMMDFWMLQRFWLGWWVYREGEGEKRPLYSLTPRLLDPPTAEPLGMNQDIYGHVITKLWTLDSIFVLDLFSSSVRRVGLSFSFLLSSALSRLVWTWLFPLANLASTWLFSRLEPQALALNLSFSFYALFTKHCGGGDALNRI